MKKIYTILAASLMIANVASAKTITIGSGKWTDAQIGKVIAAEDVVIITGQVTLNCELVVEGELQVEKGASMIGMKDLVIAKGGKFTNNGNTVMKRILNEGTINNNLIMEAMMDIDNKGSIGNNNNMVAGNNFTNYSGNAGGNKGEYFVNNNVIGGNGKFGKDVKVLYGNMIENAADIAKATSSLN